jgi:hypothetical protein
MRETSGRGPLRLEYNTPIIRSSTEDWVVACLN